MINKMASSKFIFIIRLGVLTASLFFIIAGLIRREHIEVMQKAVRICLECIGIG